MNQFTYYGFLANNILTIEEMQQQDKTVRLTEERLDVKDIRCDLQYQNFH